MTHEKVTLISPSDAHPHGLVAYVCNFLRNEHNVDAHIVSVINMPFSNDEPQRVFSEMPVGRCFVFADSSKPPAIWKDEIEEIAFFLKKSGHCYVTETTLLMPYFLYGRQDHDDKDPKRQNSVLNAKRVAEDISKYVDRVVLIDPHSEQEIGFFDTRSNIIYSSHAVAEHLSRKRHLLENLVLAPTDAGGLKRTEILQSILLKDYDIYLPLIPCHKHSRPKAEVAGQIELSGDVSGKKVLFVDDIGGTGGTSKNCECEARRKGATHVYLYVAFGEFNAGFEKYARLDGVFVTDALPNKYPGKVEVISLNNTIATAVYQAFAWKRITGHQ